MALPIAAALPVVGKLAGGVLGSILGKSAAKKQYNQQVSFAQNAIQWKAADAIKAGLHPLAALGANTVSYSPQAVGDMMGPMSDMGQDVGRAIQATANGTERATGKVAMLQLERAGLENDLLRTQIASENARLRAQIGPTLPTDGGAGELIPGQGNSLIPSKVVPPQYTKGLNMGKGVNTNPYFSDAQTIEDRYGDSEILSMLSAIMNSGADAYWNLYRPGMGKKRAYRNPNKMFRK